MQMRGAWCRTIGVPNTAYNHAYPCTVRNHSPWACAHVHVSVMAWFGDAAKPTSRCASRRTAVRLLHTYRTSNHPVALACVVTQWPLPVLSLPYAGAAEAAKPAGCVLHVLHVGTCVMPRPGSCYPRPVLRHVHMRRADHRHHGASTSQLLSEVPTLVPTPARIISCVNRTMCASTVPCVLRINPTCNSSYSTHAKAVTVHGRHMQHHTTPLQVRCCFEGRPHARTQRRKSSSAHGRTR